MANKTIANLRAVGMSPAATDRASFPGDIMLDFELDGSKLAVAAADTVEMFDIPVGAGFVVDAAAVTVVRPAVATATVDVQLAGTDVTGLTAWPIDVAGSQLVKLATAANTHVNTSGSTTHLRVQVNAAALGSGLIRVRVFGKMLSAISAQA